MRTLRGRSALVLALALAVGSSCSFGAESSPRPIPDRQRGTLSIAFGSPLSLDGQARVFLPRTDIGDGRRLGSVARLIEETEEEAFLTALIQTLFSGPSADERADGFGTAIPGDLRVLDVVPGANRVTLDISGPLTELPTDDLIVALAQIVYTMSEGFFIRDVTIRIDGADVAWPRADGSRTSNPLTVFDYPTAAITSQPAYPGIISNDADI